MQTHMHPPIEVVYAIVLMIGSTKDDSYISEIGGHVDSDMKDKNISQKK